MNDQWNALLLDCSASLLSPFKRMSIPDVDLVVPVLVSMATYQPGILGHCESVLASADVTTDQLVTTVRVVGGLAKVSTASVLSRGVSLAPLIGRYLNSHDVMLKRAAVACFPPLSSPDIPDPVRLMMNLTQHDDREVSGTALIALRSYIIQDPAKNFLPIVRFAIQLLSKLDTLMSDQLALVKSFQFANFVIQSFIDWYTDAPVTGASESCSLTRTRSEPVSSVSGGIQPRERALDTVKGQTYARDWTSLRMELEAICLVWLGHTEMWVRSEAIGILKLVSHSTFTVIEQSIASENTGGMYLCVDDGRVISLPLYLLAARHNNKYVDDVHWSGVCTYLLRDCHVQCGNSVLGRAWDVSTQVWTFMKKMCMADSVPADDNVLLLLNYTRWLLTACRVVQDKATRAIRAALIVDFIKDYIKLLEQLEIGPIGILTQNDVVDLYTHVCLDAIDDTVDAMDNLWTERNSTRSSPIWPFLFRIFMIISDKWQGDVTIHSMSTPFITLASKAIKSFMPLDVTKEPPVMQLSLPVITYAMRLCNIMIHTYNCRPEMTPWHTDVSSVLSIIKVIRTKLPPTCVEWSGCPDVSRIRHAVAWIPSEGCKDLCDPSTTTPLYGLTYTNHSLHTACLNLLSSALLLLPCKDVCMYHNVMDYVVGLLTTIGPGVYREISDCTARLMYVADDSLWSELFVQMIKPEQISRTCSDAVRHVLMYAVACNLKHKHRVECLPRHMAMVVVAINSIAESEPLRYWASEIASSVFGFKLLSYNNKLRSVHNRECQMFENSVLQTWLTSDPDQISATITFASRVMEMISGDVDAVSDLLYALQPISACAPMSALHQLMTITQTATDRQSSIASDSDRMFEICSLWTCMITRQCEMCDYSNCCHTVVPRDIIAFILTCMVSSSSPNRFIVYRSILTTISNVMGIADMIVDYALSYLWKSSYPGGQVKYPSSLDMACAVYNTGVLNASDEGVMSGVAAVVLSDIVCVDRYL